MEFLLLYAKNSERGKLTYRLTEDAKEDDISRYHEARGLSSFYYCP